MGGFGIEKGKEQTHLRTTRTGVLIMNEAQNGYEPAGRIFVQYRNITEETIKCSLQVSLSHYLKSVVKKEAIDIYRLRETIAMYDVALRHVFINTRTVGEGGLLLTADKMETTIKFQGKYVDINYELVPAYRTKFGEWELKHRIQSTEQIVYTTRKTKVLLGWAVGDKDPLWRIEIPPRGEIMVDERGKKTVQSGEELMRHICRGPFHLDTYRNMTEETLEGRVKELSSAIVEATKYRNESITREELTKIGMNSATKMTTITKNFTSI